SIRRMAGDSRTSSVPPLKARPSAARRLPLSVHSAPRTLRRNRRHWSSLMRITSSSRRKSYPTSRATARKAFRSLGKHEPPYPMPGSRNRLLMRASDPIPSTTWSMFAPTASHIVATALMKLIFIARKAFDACLISSALLRVRTLDKARVCLLQQPSGGSAVGSDHDAIGIEEVRDCRSFAQKLGIGSNLERAFGSAVQQHHLTDPLAGANRDGALLHDDRM